MELKNIYPFFSSEFLSRGITKYGILDRELLERQRAREEKESFADLFR